MIAARKYSLQSVLKPSSTFWSAGVNGGDFHMTIPNGRVSIITTINGGRRDGLNIFCKNLSEKYGSDVVRHQARQSARSIPRVSNGVADRR